MTGAGGSEGGVPSPSYPSKPLLSSLLTRASLAKVSGGTLQNRKLRVNHKVPPL